MAPKKRGNPYQKKKSRPSNAQSRSVPTQPSSLPQAAKNTQQLHASLPPMPPLIDSTSPPLSPRSSLPFLAKGQSENRSFADLDQCIILLIAEYADNAIQIASMMQTCKRFKRVLESKLAKLLTKTVCKPLQVLSFNTTGDNFFSYLTLMQGTFIKTTILSNAQVHGECEVRYGLYCEEASRTAFADHLMDRVWISEIRGHAGGTLKPILMEIREQLAQSQRPMQKGKQPAKPQPSAQAHDSTLILVDGRPLKLSAQMTQSLLEFYDRNSKFPEKLNFEFGRLQGSTTSSWDFEDNLHRGSYNRTRCFNYNRGLLHGRAWETITKRDKKHDDETFEDLINPDEEPDMDYIMDDDDDSEEYPYDNDYGDDDSSDDIITTKPKKETREKSDDIDKSKKDDKNSEKKSEKNEKDKDGDGDDGEKDRFKTNAKYHFYYSTNFVNGKEHGECFKIENGVMIESHHFEANEKFGESQYWHDGIRVLSVLWNWKYSTFYVRDLTRQEKTKEDAMKSIPSNYHRFNPRIYNLDGHADELGFGRYQGKEPHITWKDKFETLLSGKKGLREKTWTDTGELTFDTIRFPSAVVDLRPAPTTQLEEKRQSAYIKIQDYYERPGQFRDHILNRDFDDGIIGEPSLQTRAPHTYLYPILQRVHTILNPNQTNVSNNRKQKPAQRNQPQQSQYQRDVPSLEDMLDYAMREHGAAGVLALMEQLRLHK